jgi:hypothetical protein
MTDWKALNFFVVSLLTSIVACICGLVFAAIAWVQMGSKPDERTPAAMRSFAGAIVFDAASLATLWYKPSNIWDRIATSCLIASCILALIALKLLSSYSGPGRGALKVGSIVVIVVYILGFISILTG